MTVPFSCLRKVCSECPPPAGRTAPRYSPWSIPTNSPSTAYRIQPFPLPPTPHIRIWQSAAQPERRRSIPRKPFVRSKERPRSSPGRTVVLDPSCGLATSARYACEIRSIASRVLWRFLPISSIAATFDVGYRTLSLGWWDRAGTPVAAFHTLAIPTPAFQVRGFSRGRRGGPQKS